MRSTSLEFRRLITLPLDWTSPRVCPAFSTFDNSFARGRSDVECSGRMGESMVKKILLPLFAVALLFHAVHAFAQAGTGQVTGVVQDATKALVPGVTITLNNTNTGITNTQVTDESGVYTFQSVPPGIYTAVSY